MSEVLSEIKVIDDLKDIVGDVVTKKIKTKHMLEEQIRDIAPIEFEEETDEKIKAVVEAGEKMQKEAAKKMKHDTGGKTKEPKHQVRQALAK